MKRVQTGTTGQKSTLSCTKEIGTKLFDLSVQRSTILRSMQHAYGDYSVFGRHISYLNSNTEGTFFIDGRRGSGAKIYLVSVLHRRGQGTVHILTNEPYLPIRMQYIVQANMESNL